MATVLLAIALVGCSATFLARAASVRRLRTVRQLRQIAVYGFAGTAAAAAETADAGPGPIGRIGLVVVPRLSEAKIRRTRDLLHGAGFHGTGVETYFGYCALALVGMPLLMLWFASSTAAPGSLAAVEIAIGTGMGWLLPRTYVSRGARVRLEQVDYSMPELVDLLLVGVESGMGLNGAMRVASARLNGPLGDEMLLVLRQQSLGASTNEALKNMLDRCDTPAVRSFVRTITQGERLGVSIGQMMRSLAEEMRKRRKALAEERAHKTPIKILFPLVFMILPAMFIVLLTPAALNMAEFFGSR